MTRRPTSSITVVIALSVGMATAVHAAAGGLDPTFSSDGKTITAFGDTQGATGVAVRPDGRVVVAGWTSVGADPAEFAVAQYTASGARDPSFGGGDGMVTTAFTQGSAYANDVALLADGRIAVVGAVGDPVVRFAIVRYTADGDLDTSFSGDGMKVVSFGGSQDEARSLSLMGNQVVVAGFSIPDGGGPVRVAVARLTSSGALDTSFSTDGKVLTLVTDESLARDVIIVDGRIVVAGRAEVYANERFLLMRYLPDGTLDPSFGGGDGWLTTRFDTGPGADADAYGIAAMADGRLVVAGEADVESETFSDFAVARYSATGVLDATFSGDGRAKFDFGGYENAKAVAVQPDGAVVVVGAFQGPEPANSRQAVFRATVGGAADTEFGGDGLRAVNVKANSSYESADALAIHDGKIVVVGYAQGESAGASSWFTAFRMLGS